MEQNNKLNLKKYASLASLALSAGAVNAENIYTDVSPDENIQLLPVHGIGDELSHELDINNDGTIDAKLVTYIGYYQYKPHRAKEETFGVKISALNDSKVSSGYFYLNTFEAGAEIDEQDETWKDGYIKMAFQDHNGKVEGSWAGQSLKFIGVQLHVDGNTHYGWVRVSVDSDAKGFQVIDYAYNDVPGEAITIDKSLNVKDRLGEEFDIKIQDNQLTVENALNKKNLNLQLIDINGRVSVSENMVFGSNLVSMPGEGKLYILIVKDNKMIYDRRMIFNINETWYISSNK